MSHFTVNTVGNAPDVWDKTIVTIAQIDRVISDNPGILIKVNTTADIRRAKREGKSAVLYGTQDTSLVGADLDRLGLLRGLGVRSVQLTYNLRNLCGDGSLEPSNAGLSKLGHATIARIEKEKMLVDFSHGRQRTIAEGIAATTRPPIISHTGCRSQSAREARTPVPLREPTAGGQRAPGADGIGPGALHAQDAVPGRHHPHRDRAGCNPASDGKWRRGATARCLELARREGIHTAPCGESGEMPPS